MLDDKIARSRALTQPVPPMGVVFDARTRTYHRIAKLIVVSVVSR